MASTEASRPSPQALLLGVLTLALVAGCRGGCVPGSDGGGGRDRRLALMPAETRMVASVDLARVRATAFWKRLSELAQDDPADRRVLVELEKRTGLDPLRQVHRIFAAFPEEARRTGEFAVLIEGTGFDEKRLVAYARDQAALEGGKIDQRSAFGRTLWSGTGPQRLGGFFMGGTAFALGAGGWAERMAELAGGGSARQSSASWNAELGRLVGRIDSGRAIWFAAIVPPDLRQSLRADPRFDAAASVGRIAAAVDLGPGLQADLVAELSNADDARALVARLQTTIKEAKRNARVLMLGLGPYLDGLAVAAQGAAVRVQLSLPEAQVDDLLARLVAVARLTRGKPRP